METFKYGEKVTHQLHGTGTVGNSYRDQKLVTVFFENGDEFGTLVHPVSLTKVSSDFYEDAMELEEDADAEMFTVVDSFEMDEAGNRYDSAGRLIFHPEAPGRGLIE